MKKVSLEISDRQYSQYEKAAEALLQLGIPVTPKNIMQILISSQSAEQISDDFLKTMRSLISQGRKMPVQNQGEKKV